MKTWKIPVYYQMAGTIEVEANSIEEAMDIARDEAEEIPLPDNAEYLDGSWETSDLGAEELRELYNDGQSDN